MLTLMLVALMRRVAAAVLLLERWTGAGLGIGDWMSIYRGYYLHLQYIVLKQWVHCNASGTPLFLEISTKVEHINVVVIKSG